MQPLTTVDFVVLSPDLVVLKSDSNVPVWIGLVDAVIAKSRLVLRFAKNLLCQFFVVFIVVITFALVSPRSIASKSPCVSEQI